MAKTTADAAKQPLRMFAATQGAIVSVFIGSDRKKFSVHEEVLKEHTEYFNRALEGPWKEADEGTA
ncbi:hypothetical protein E8E11_001680 [Didymella keratinophila]|nr:hypothetical protein E8E11_001680 [Didymella keratinophila]